jgi:pyrroline-5-carboxylate reductase
MHHSLLSDFTGTLVLAGAGKMGGAMLSGWLAGGLDAERVVVIEPQPAPEIATLAQRGLQLNPSLDTLKVDVLILAVKPQMFGEVAPRLAPAVSLQTLVVSIMAGVPVARMRQAVGGAIVRAMPNTPAAIGRGIAAAFAASDVTEDQRDLADTLLRATGDVAWIDDEALMDAVTAVSGSGPAYVFLLAEELAKAGVAAGLPDALATQLARATVAGAGELLHRSELDAATLRQNVTSPAGTTAAALSVLMADDGFAPLLTRAIAAATKRSKELAG